MQLQIRYKHEAATKSWLQLFFDFLASLKIQNSENFRSCINILFELINDNLRVEVCRVNIFSKNGCRACLFEICFNLLPRLALTLVFEDLCRYFKVCIQGIHFFVVFGPDKGFSFNYFLLEERNQNDFAEPLRNLWYISFQVCNDHQKLLDSNLKVFRLEKIQSKQFIHP